MGHLRSLIEQDRDIWHSNRGWMTWNLALAVIPALLASALLPHRGSRTVGWWVGVATFALFLPNAPYVVTDLIHLSNSTARPLGASGVVGGLLPMFAAFVAAGYVAYLYAMDRIVDEVRSVRPAARRLPIEMAVHVACAVGIVLGRVARLNSWDSITHPRSTLERSFTTLAWDGAPVALVLVFLAVLITYTVMRALVLWLGRTRSRLTHSWHAATQEGR